MLPILTIMHPLVDACSMGVLAVGGMAVERILLYNALAFALQLPLGVVADARPRLSAAGFSLGVGLVCAATLAAALGAGGWGVLSAACFGNALFHLTAGKHVLDAHGGRSGPAGLFISTGALGLLAGRLGVERWDARCLPVFAALLGLCVALAVVRGVLGALGGQERRHPSGTRRLPLEVAILAGLFALIAWRSWAGLEATRMTMAQGVAFLAAGAAVTWGGKVVGGYLADLAGRWTVTAASVCGSVALAFACSPENMVAWLVLLFVSQLATGPVLSLAYENSGRSGGTAFGLNCLGIFAGSL